MFGQGVNLVTKGMVPSKCCTLVTKGMILCEYKITPPEDIGYGGSSYRSPVGKIKKKPLYTEISLKLTCSGDTKTMIKKKYHDISVKEFEMINIREGLKSSDISVFLVEDFWDNRKKGLDN